MLEFAKDLDKMHRVWLDGNDVKIVKLWCDILRSRVGQGRRQLK